VKHVRRFHSVFEYKSSEVYKLVFLLSLFSEGMSKVNTVNNFVFKIVKINFVSASANLRVFGGRVTLLFSSFAYEIWAAGRTGKTAEMLYM